MNKERAKEEAVVKALKGMLDMYVQMVESGDCGFWNAEKDKEVIVARKALAEYASEGKDEGYLTSMGMRVYKDA